MNARAEGRSGNEARRANMRIGVVVLVLLATLILQLEDPAVGQTGTRSIARVYSAPTSLTGGGSFKIYVELSSASGPAVELRFYSHNFGAAPFSGTTGSIPDGVALRAFSFSSNPVATDTAVNYTVVQLDGRGFIVDSSSGQVTIKSPRVTGLSVTPNQGVGGASQAPIATVQLDGRAPGAGARVALTSSRPDLVEVSTQVVVQPGLTRIDFPLVTKPAAAAASIQITATRAGQSQNSTVGIQPPSPIAIRLARAMGGPQPVPPRMLGGFHGKGLIELSGPAPAGGIVLSLDTDEPGAVGVPPEVFVPEGAIQAPIVLTTNAVRFDTEAIVRSVNSTTGLGAESAIVVEPAVVASFSVDPESVVGGSSTSGFVYLEGVAPPGGLTFSIASSAPALAGVPAAVTVGAGLGEGEFAVSTTRVTDATTVQFTLTDPFGHILTTNATLVPSRRGDADGNGTVDSLDHRSLVGCLKGPRPLPPPGDTPQCLGVFGFADRSAGIDLRDFAGFQNSFTGPLEGEPRVWVVVDEGLRPPVAELGPLDGAPPGPRPLAAMADETGSPSYFVANELMLVTPDLPSVNGFVGRWRGQLLESVAIPDGSGARFSLVRIDTSLAVPAGVEKDLADMFIRFSQGAGLEQVTKLHVSGDAGLRLLTAATRERLAGNLVSPNWIPVPQGFSDRQLEEAATGPGTYVPNPFCWDYMRDVDSGGKDIGVTEAWRAMDAAGRLIPNSIEIAIVELGVRMTPSVLADFPGLSIVPDPTVDLSTVPPNPLPCIGPTGSSMCPFHGVNVLSAAMAVPGNSLGSAGPAGPVGSAKLFVAPQGSSRFRDLFTFVGSVLAELGPGGSPRIFNFSGTVDVSPIVGAFVDALNAVFDALDIFRDEVLIFAAAGNENRNVDQRRVFAEKRKFLPCELSGVICVGGIDVGSFLTRHPSSNFGNEDVDIWAPFSVWVGPDPGVSMVQQVNGTSMATPFAAGVAALIWAANPSLRARQVKDILFENASDSPDSRVKRIVNAFDAVLDPRVGLPGDPPSICINVPDDGTSCALAEPTCEDGIGGPTAAMNPMVLSYSKGIGFYLSADVHDRECPDAQVVWTSNRQSGSIATGTSTSALLMQVGRHTITATATDCTGLSAADSVAVDIVNDAPLVQILKPVDRIEVCRNETVEFVAQVFDRNEFPSWTLPNASVEWFSDLDARRIGIGKTIAVGLTTAGLHSISVRVVDSDGAGAIASVPVRVLGGTCTAFESFGITRPIADVIGCPLDSPYFVDMYDATVGLKYTEVTFEGQAFDQEDGWLAGAAFDWRTDQTPIQPATLGTGGRVTVRLYLGAGASSTQHRVTLTATDNDGNTRTATRIVTVCDII